MLGDALRYPRTADDWVSTLLIGGALSLLSFLVIPTIVVQGYLVRVIRRVADGDPTPPSFTGWGGLLVDGVKLLAVNLAYGLVAFAVVAAFGFAGDALGGAVGGLVGLVGFLAAALIAYAIPAALVRFAATDRVGAAFDLADIRAVVTREGYAVGVLIGVLVAFVGSLIGSALTVVLVGFVVVFYAQVAAFYCFARGYDDATGSAEPTPDPTDDPAGQV